MSLLSSLQAVATPERVAVAQDLLGHRTTKLALGALTTGAVLAGGAATHRVVQTRRRLAQDPAADEPLGQLTGREHTVTTDDGVPLYVVEVGPADAPLTMVAVHGYTNLAGVWHYQHQAFDRHPDGVRLVMYDQRGHGRSGAGDEERSTIAQLGEDLLAVLDQRVPTGPVVLVGHSMGGMTIMALVRRHPELLGTRVAGVALVSTSAGGLAELTLGFPAFFLRITRRLVPLAGRSVARRPDLIQNGLRTGTGLAVRVGGPVGRRAGEDLGLAVTEHFAFGTRPVSRSLLAFVERMTLSTRLETVTQFYTALMNHDELAALPLLDAVPTTIMVGSADLLAPPDHSFQMQRAVPSARLVVLPDAGHMIQLEQPDEVTDELRQLADRARRFLRDREVAPG